MRHLFTFLLLFGCFVLPLPAQTASPSLRERALAAEQAKDIAQATTLWQQVLVLAPADPEANAHLGLDLALQGQYAQATPFYRKAFTANPAMPGLALNFGLALFKQGDLAGAVEPLEQAAQTAGKDPRPKLLLGMAYYGTGKYTAAIPNLRDGLEMTPNSLQLRLALAQSCLWAKDYNCALEQDKLILEQDPNSAEADMITGEALDAKGDSPGAIAQFQAAEGASPNTPNLHFGLGYLYWKQGRFADAEPEFAKEISLDPHHTQALTYLGDLAVKRNDWTVAREDLQQAAAAPNAVSLTFLDLGIVDAHDHRNDQAEANLKKAAALTPEDPEPHYRLARLLQASGKAAEARTELAKVQQLHQAKDQNLVGQLPAPATAAPK